MNKFLHVASGVPQKQVNVIEKSRVFSAHVVSTYIKKSDYKQNIQVAIYL